MSANLSLGTFADGFDLERFLLSLSGPEAGPSGRGAAPSFEGPVAIGNARAALEHAQRLLSTFEAAENSLASLQKQARAAAARCPSQRPAACTATSAPPRRSGPAAPQPGTHGAAAAYSALALADASLPFSPPPPASSA